MTAVRCDFERLAQKGLDEGAGETVKAGSCSQGLAAVGRECLSMQYLI